jgi:hydroxyacylglutathione hydrolase
MLSVETIDTIELGDRSYVAHDGDCAIVIDPQRDVDRVIACLRSLSLRLAMVCDTHVHNDYLSGGLALSRFGAVPYVVSDSAPLGFPHLSLRDGESTTAGGLRLRAISTPGHTPQHVSYVVESGDDARALFTGGSMLYGGVGRTDLVDADAAVEHARAQYRSVRRLAAAFPPDTPLYPTHGFGSFCSSRTPSNAITAGSVGDEQTRNPALTTDDEDGFADRLVAGLPPYPTYYADIAPRNRAGVDPPDLSIGRALAEPDLHQRLLANQWVIDLRPRRDFAADHLVGSLSFEVGPPFGTYLGWIAPTGAPLTLLGADPDQVAAAQRQLVRIGWDRPDGVAVGTLDSIAPNAPRSSYPVVHFGDLPDGRVENGSVVLDVRRPDERASGHVRDAVHVPLHALLDPDTVLPEGELWVHCASGFRASIAASLLHRMGRDVVLIDDDMGHADDLRLVVR